MTAATAPPRGPRPKHPSYDAPVPGPAVVYYVDVEGSEPSKAIVKLLGAGRGNQTRDEFVAGIRQTLAEIAAGDSGVHGSAWVSAESTSIEALLADPKEEE